MSTILKAAKSPSTEQDPKQAPLPEPWGVLYAPPNPDGSRKMCRNCASFSPESEECYWIDPEGGAIQPTQVCGLHTYAPEENLLPRFNRIEGMKVYSMAEAKKLLGLENTEDGTSCNLCAAYEGDDKKGICHGVQVKGQPAPVQGFGCCARWVKR